MQAVLGLRRKGCKSSKKSKFSSKPWSAPRHCRASGYQPRTGRLSLQGNPRPLLLTVGRIISTGFFPLYSSATDGSTDNGLKKMNPLTVQTYDVNLKRVKTGFLDMCLSSGSTAEILFQGIDECLASHRIPCVSSSRTHQYTSMDASAMLYTIPPRLQPKHSMLRPDLTWKTSLSTFIIGLPILRNENAS